MATLDDTAAPVAEKSVESSASAVEWASIFGGALAAFGVTIILLTLGPGLGLATVSPWSLTTPSPTTFGTVAAIWLVVTQWLSSAFGGYLAGRLRTKWVGIRTEEVFFRDTARPRLREWQRPQPLRLAERQFHPKPPSKPAKLP
jgi:hypothetical protein